MVRILKRSTQMKRLLLAAFAVTVFGLSLHAGGSKCSTQQAPAGNSQGSSSDTNETPAGQEGAPVEEDVTSQV